MKSETYSIVDAIRNTFDVDIDKECPLGYEVIFRHKYCGCNIVDVIVIDRESGGFMELYCYDLSTHCFPWSHEDGNYIF